MREGREKEKEYDWMDGMKKLEQGTVDTSGVCGLHTAIYTFVSTITYTDTAQVYVGHM